MGFQKLIRFTPMIESIICQPQRNQVLTLHSYNTLYVLNNP